MNVPSPNRNDASADNGEGYVFALDLDEDVPKGLVYLYEEGSTSGPMCLGTSREFGVQGAADENDPIYSRGYSAVVSPEVAADIRSRFLEHFPAFSVDPDVECATPAGYRAKRVFAWARSLEGVQITPEILATAPEGIRLVDDRALPSEILADRSVTLDTLDTVRIDKAAEVQRLVDLVTRDLALREGRRDRKARRAAMRRSHPAPATGEDVDATKARRKAQRDARRKNRRR